MKLKVEEVELKFQLAIDQLLEAYDEHMKRTAPAPQLLPVRLNVQIECKQELRFDNLNMKPYDNFNDLKRLVMELSEKRGDRILAFEESVQFFIQGPLYQNNEHMMIEEEEKQNELTKRVKV
jgi:hypothetical protein